MRDQRLRISFSDLPSRPRGLGDSELDRVFGGNCSNRACKRDADCCLRTCYFIPGSNSTTGFCRPGLG